MKKRAAASRARSLLVGSCLVAALIAATSSTAVAADQKAFCATNVKINLAFNQLLIATNGQPSGPVVQQAQAPILKLVDQMVNTAPAAIVDQVKAMAAVLHANFEAGLNDPALSAASSKVDNYAVKNCGYHVINITAVDYAFQGVPKTLKTGIVVVNFKDAGSESHEINIDRFKTSDTVKTLLALPQGQAKTRLEPLGSAGSDPGQTSVGYFQLTKPGRYVAVCLVPQGTTSSDHQGTGPPHLRLGMHAEFNVTK